MRRRGITCTLQFHIQRAFAASLLAHVMLLLAARAAQAEPAGGGVRALAAIPSTRAA
jgi:hypothetical protein